MWDEVFPIEGHVESAVTVLVAVVPSLADWRRVQDEGWYRIPLRRAPQQIGAEYIAFYHPGCFGAWRWSIRTYAAVQEYRVVTRRELLPDEPDHPRALELYYRIALGPLQPLPHPVYSQRLRRVTFIRTDMEALFGASEICDLWRHEDRRVRLWRGLQISAPRATYRAHAA